MTESEKARAYDKALEKAKKIHDNAKELRCIVEAVNLETIFPELKESKDERIRRNIIAALKGEGYYDCDLTNECIAWLERQGESKQEWSEEDENMADDLIKGCISAEKAHHFIHTPKEVADWLKSLKERIGG